LGVFHGGATPKKKGVKTKDKTMLQKIQRGVKGSVCGVVGLKQKTKKKSVLGTREPPPHPTRNG